MQCGHCGYPDPTEVLDLGTAPPSNRLVKKEALDASEVFFPLGLFRCAHCGLVQTNPIVRDQDLFDDDYPYFSSVSASWLAHAQRYTDQVVPRFSLDNTSFVVEVAANDGYLLRNFLERSIPCLGVEPTPGPAAKAKALGIEIEEAFFDSSLAHAIYARRGPADLIICNNVFAHVSRVNQFAQAISDLLNPSSGVLTIEFPHLANLLVSSQFDTIYHEHFYYFSLRSIQTVLRSVQIRIFDVELVPTHGGSLRVFACKNGAIFTEDERVTNLLKREQSLGLDSPEIYQQFATKSKALKNLFLRKIVDLRLSRKTVFGYGAAAKGSTLLNWSGIKSDLITAVLDNNPAKQGRFMPGCRIPIYSPDYLRSHKADAIVIFPWNLAPEIEGELRSIYNWSGEIISLPVLAQAL
jgi:hypothetical protein